MNEKMKKFDSSHNSVMWGIDSVIIASFLLLLALDAFVWFRIFFAKPSDEPRMYFLDVGQGDAELAILPGGVKILTDAGPDKKILQEMENIPALSNRYIDLAIISHPQLDHFNGFQYLLEKYRIGAFIFNGRSGAPEVKEWETLVNKIKDSRIPFIALAGGDAIRHENSRMDFLSPNADFIQSAELNDTGLVELLNIAPPSAPSFAARRASSAGSRGLKVLLLADIGSNIEQYLAGHFNIEADILKVPHHGSKFSSSGAFLKKVNPKVAVIEVGARNRYGHPTKETLERLASSTSAKVFRTDLNGAVSAILENGKLKIFTEK